LRQSRFLQAHRGVLRGGVDPGIEIKIHIYRQHKSRDKARDKARNNKRPPTGAEDEVEAEFTYAEVLPLVMGL
jgi:hypothetical protein